MCRVYAVEPGTPEGQLIRAARKRKRLSMAQAAGVLGMSAEKIGYIERGYNKLRVPYVVSDSDFAEIAAKLGIPAEELERVNRAEAAVLLRGFPAPPPEARPFDTDTAAALDRMFEAILNRAALRPIRPAEAENLRNRWHELDGELRLLPLADRARGVARWIEENPAQPQADGNLRAV